MLFMLLHYITSLDYFLHFLNFRDDCSVKVFVKLCALLEYFCMQLNRLCFIYTVHLSHLSLESLCCHIGWLCYYVCIIFEGDKK